MIQGGEYLTSHKLYSMGMFSCYECGALNCIDSPKCKKCNYERFYVLQETPTQPRQIAKPAREENGGGGYSSTIQQAERLRGGKEIEKLPWFDILFKS